MVMTSKSNGCKSRPCSELGSTRTHESSRVGGVGADLAVDLDQALHNNGEDLLAGKRILQTVAEEDGEGEGLAELVGTRGGTGSLSKL